MFALLEKPANRDKTLEAALAPCIKKMPMYWQLLERLFPNQTGWRGTQLVINFTFSIFFSSRLQGKHFSPSSAPEST